MSIYLVDDAEIESIVATLLRAQKNFENVAPSIDPEEYRRKLATYKVLYTTTLALFGFVRSAVSEGIVTGHLMACLICVFLFIVVVVIQKF